MESPHRSAEVGALGERIAEDYLATRGCAIVGRNIRVGADEIDLIVRDGRSLVAVEVKCSTTEDDPLQAVDDAKYRRLERAAAAFRHRIMRIDIVTVRMTRDLVEVRWLRGVD